jgi:hypothetical protein
MQDPLDPAAMTPEERAREVASILAAGYLRHRALRAPAGAPPAIHGAPPPVPDTSPETEKGLDRPGDQAALCGPG